MPGGAGVFGEVGVEGCHLSFEFGDDLGVFFGEVVFLTKVFFEVEEEILGGGVGILFGLASVLNEKFVVPGSDAFEIALGGVVDELLAWSFVGTFEEIGDVDSVDFFVGGQRGVGEFCDGGEEVDGAAELIAGRVGGNSSGSPHDAGNTLSAFEGGAFAIAEWSGAAAVVFELEPGAVVGSEDEVGVLIEL